MTSEVHALNLSCVGPLVTQQATTAPACDCLSRCHLCGKKVPADESPLTIIYMCLVFIIGVMREGGCSCRTRRRGVCFLEEKSRVRTTNGLLSVPLQLFNWKDITSTMIQHKPTHYMNHHRRLALLVVSRAALNSKIRRSVSLCL